MAERKKGRPPFEITEEVLKKAEEAASRGLTQAQIAQALGMGESTLYRKQALFGELEEAIKRGQAQGIQKVANALFERAMGYSCLETKTHVYNGRIMRRRVVKHYPPDTVAAIFYLKNRAPEEWKDRVPEGIGGEEPTPVGVTFQEIEDD